MGFIIWGLFMCILGLIDLMGADWRVEKAYRERPERKVWQRKMAIAELVSGISGGISHFIDNKWGIIITGVIGISAIIFIGINNRRFYKETSDQ